MRVFKCNNMWGHRAMFHNKKYLVTPEAPLSVKYFLTGPRKCWYLRGMVLQLFYTGGNLRVGSF